MDLHNTFSTDVIYLGIDYQTKEELIQYLVHELEKNGYVSDAAGFYSDVIEREKISLTAIGDYIAIPHAQSEYVTKSVIAVGRNKHPIVWDSNSEMMVNVVFMFAVGTNPEQLSQYIGMLSMLAKKLAQKEVLSKIQEVSSYVELVELLNN